MSRQSGDGLNVRTNFVSIGLRGDRRAPELQCWACHSSRSIRMMLLMGVIGQDSRKVMSRTFKECKGSKYEPLRSSSREKHAAQLGVDSKVMVLTWHRDNVV